MKGPRQLLKMDQEICALLRDSYAITHPSRKFLAGYTTDFRKHDLNFSEQSLLRERLFVTESMRNLLTKCSRRL